ncbi:MAG: hypothetical protein C0494_10715 [Sphingobium sp.]|nr:hypothetical protein [Sphingobium sp.]
MRSELALRQAVVELETLQGQLGTLPHDDSVEWKRSLIQLRRLLQQQVVLVGQALADCETINADHSMKSHLRDLFSKMRSAIAFHQAQYPAVSIDLIDPAYKMSVQMVHAESLNFVTAIKRILPTI